ncbi:MAG: THUMP domain-containing protein, partial [Desulfuromonadaceae bacterium]
MKKSVEKLFAVTAPGLEEICARELEALGMGKINLGAGGVEFTGGLREIYRSNLWLRSASRILVRLATFKSRDFPDLYGKSVRLPWGRFIPSEMGVQIRVSSQRSRLNH